MGSLLMSEKNDIRFLMRSGDFEQAYKKLFRCFNKQYESVGDNWFVLYYLSYVCKQLREISKSKYYVEILRDYIYQFKDYNTEKCWALWLYIEINKDSMSKEQLNNEYDKLIEGFNLPNDSEKIIGLKNSKDVINRNFENVKKNFLKCLEKHYIDTVKAMINEIKDINLELYKEFDKLFMEYQKQELIIV